MGIIDGAIIGGILGGGMAAYMVWKTAQWQKKLIAAVDAGDRDGARRMVERNAKAVPRAKSFPLSKLLPQRHRLIALWLVDRTDEVRAELQIHGDSGAKSPAYLVNVHMWGLLAQAVDAADPAPFVAELQATAARVEKESNALQKLLRDYANMIAGVAGGLAGQPVDEAVVRKLQTKVQNEPVLVRIMVLRMLVVIGERAGKPALQLQRQLALLTKKWAGATAPA